MFDPSSQIRVLVIHGGEENSPISASFEYDTVQPGRYPVENGVVWDAISYAWDDESGWERIRIDGETKPRRVRANVWTMLNDLRHPIQKRFFWIDSVCINQQDFEEKSKQVRLMRYIYEQARSVIIWLPYAGPYNPASAIAHAHKWMQVSKSNHSIASKPLVQSFTEQRPEIPWTGPIHYILSTRWFQRIWVVQEATLPKHLLVQIGRQALAWDDFVSIALRFLSNLKAGDAINATLDVCYSVCKDKVFDTAVQKGLSMINVIANLRQWLHMPYDIPIPASELVYLCRDRQATQDVDKVYALHGLFEGKGYSQPATAFGIDYKLTPEEVYMRFTIWCIERECNLDVLAQQRHDLDTPLTISFTTSKRDFFQRIFRSIKRRWASHLMDSDAFSTAVTNSVLPTWAPDLRVSNDFITPHTNPILSNLSQLRRNCSDPPIYRRIGNILILRGFVVDYVDQPDLGAAWFRHIGTRPDPEQVSSLLPKQFLDLVLNKDWLTPHLWRDGHSLSTPREDYFIWRGPLVTRGGRIAIAFPIFVGLAKVCCLIGGRSLFLLQEQPEYAPQSGRRLHKIHCGDCLIDGFEDGKGVAMARSLGLEEEDIYII